LGGKSSFAASKRLRKSLRNTQDYGIHFLGSVTISKEVQSGVNAEKSAKPRMQLTVA
jgi:hypothetical protein